MNVNAGTLGGKGSITGAVTIGTGSGVGAFLAPGVGSNQAGKLTFKKTLTFTSTHLHLQAEYEQWSSRLGESKGNHH